MTATRHRWRRGAARCRAWTAGLASVLTLATLGRCCPAESALRVQDPIRDLGVVRQNEIVSVRFAVTNAGQRRVRIVSAAPSCTCVSLDLTDPDVQPGGQCSVRAKLAVGLLEGDQVNSIILGTEEPNAEPLVLKVVFRVVPEFRVSPTDLKFAFGQDGKWPSQTVQIVPLADPPAVPVAVSSDSPAFTAHLDVTEDGTPAVVVSLTDPPPQGDHRGVVTITTNSEYRPHVDIVAEAEVPGPWVCQPTRVGFGFVTAGKADPVIRTIRINRRDRVAFAVEELRCMGAPFSAEVVGLGEQATHEIRVRMDQSALVAPKESAELVSGNLCVRMQGAQGYALVVPLLAALAARGTVGLQGVSTQRLRQHAEEGHRRSPEGRLTTGGSRRPA